MRGEEFVVFLCEKFCDKNGIFYVEVDTVRERERERERRKFGCGEDFFFFVRNCERKTECFTC